jgi:hypothetical protein
MAVERKRKKYAKNKRKIVPVSNAFDCDGAFVELQEVKAFTKYQIALVVKIHPESLVPQNEPPLLNIIGQVQNLCRHPINVHGQLVLKRCNLGLNPFSNYVKRDQQLEMEKSETNKREKTKHEDVHVSRKKLC